MPILRLTVPDGPPQRLDKIVSSMADVGSRSKARKVIDSGKVSINGRFAGAGDSGTMVTAGAQVALDSSRAGTAPAKVKARRQLDDAGLSILFEDDRLLALNKPVGLLTDTATSKQARERDSLRKRAHAYLRAHHKHAIVVHRIDRDTSGVVLLAKDEAAGEFLRDQFRKRSPERVYQAFVHGRVSDDDAIWTNTVTWDKKRLLLIAVPPSPDVWHAESRARVVARFRSCTLIEVSLTTGKRNQIRLQAHLRGHPLVGERLYVRREWTPPLAPRLDRQALHAHRLSVLHPTTKAKITFTVPLPPDMEGLLGWLKGHDQ